MYYGSEHEWRLPSSAFICMSSREQSNPGESDLRTMYGQQWMMGSTLFGHFGYVSPYEN